MNIKVLSLFALLVSSANALALEHSCAFENSNPDVIVCSGWQFEMLGQNYCETGKSQYVHDKNMDKAAEFLGNLDSYEIIENTFVYIDLSVNGLTSRCINTLKLAVSGARSEIQNRRIDQPRNRQNNSQPTYSEPTYSQPTYSQPSSNSGRRKSYTCSFTFYRGDGPTEREARQDLQSSCLSQNMPLSACAGYSASATCREM